MARSAIAVRKVFVDNCHTLLQAAIRQCFAIALNNDFAKGLPKLHACSDNSI